MNTTIEKPKKAKKLLGKQILIVDDEPDLRDLLKSEIEYQGAEVFTCKNGSEAFEFLKKNKVHAVVSDVRMPGGDGVGLIENCMAEFGSASPRIYLVTGFSDISAEAAKRKGATDVFSKPVDWDELVEALAR